jgi:hypothetical protein
MTDQPGHEHDERSATPTPPPPAGVADGAAPRIELTNHELAQLIRAACRHDGRGSVPEAEVEKLHGWMVGVKVDAVVMRLVVEGRITVGWDDEAGEPIFSAYDEVAA